MRFSLVIPLAPERGAEILDSINKLDFPKSEFHVIVVRGRNPSNNRNKGAYKSKGEIIGFLDDDAVLDKNILSNVDKFFKEHPDIDIVGGPQLTPPNDKTFARVSGYAFSSVFGAWKMSNRYDLKHTRIDVDETTLTSANLFCKKGVLDKIKFDPSLFPGEDPKFIEDAKKLGLRVAYSPNLIIYHRRRPTIKTLAKQIFNYGKVRPAKENFWQTLTKPFFLIPSMFFIYLVSLLFLVFLNQNITGAVIGTQFRNAINLMLFFPLALYLLLDLIFSAYSSIKYKDLIGFFILVFIFPIIHLSYGYGMIYGYTKKILKKY